MAFEVVQLKDALHSKVMGDIEDILYEGRLQAPTALAGVPLNGAWRPCSWEKSDLSN